MHETDADLERLQALLDASYAAAGPHLSGIHSVERRHTAHSLVERLQGMCLLTLATVTADGRPVTGPVDGFFYRGCFHFGSSPESVRFRHISARPQVSATHLPSEALAVSVHGRAVRIDVLSDDEAGFKQTLLDYYVPRYGAGWADMLERGAAYARIEPVKMFAFNGEGL